MEAHGNRAKRWPGQLSNTSEEISQAERDRELKKLIRETGKLKRRIVGEKAVKPDREWIQPEPDADPRDKPTSSGTVEASLNSVGEQAWRTACGWRGSLNRCEWLRDLSEDVRAGLWELLGYLRLYRLRDSVMENLEWGNGNGGTPRCPDAEIRSVKERSLSSRSGVK